MRMRKIMVDGSLNGEGFAVIRGFGRSGEDVLVSIEEIGGYEGGGWYVTVYEIGEAAPEDYDEYPVVSSRDWEEIWEIEAD